MSKSVTPHVPQVNANHAHEWTAQDIADYNAHLDDVAREQEEREVFAGEFLSHRIKFRTRVEPLRISYDSNGNRLVNGKGGVA